MYFTQILFHYQCFSCIQFLGPNKIIACGILFEFLSLWQHFVLLKIVLRLDHVLKSSDFFSSNSLMSKQFSYYPMVLWRNFFSNKNYRRVLRALAIVLPLGGWAGPAPMLNMLLCCCCWGVWGMAPKVGVACWDPPKAKPPAAGAAPLDGAAGAEPKAKLGGDAAAAPKLKPPWEDWDGFAAAPYDGGGGWPKVDAGAPEKREWNWQ